MTGISLEKNIKQISENLNGKFVFQKKIFINNNSIISSN